MLFFTAKLLRDDATIRRRLAAQCRHLLIDEFQVRRCRCERCNTSPLALLTRHLDAGHQHTAVRNIMLACPSAQIHLRGRRSRPEHLRMALRQHRQHHPNNEGLPGSCAWFGCGCGAWASDHKVCHHQGAAIVKLEQNYRSTKNVLACANHIMGQAVGARSTMCKKLWTDNRVASVRGGA